MAGCVIASRLLPCIQKDWDWFRSESLVSCLSFALTDVRNCGNLYYQSIWPGTLAQLRQWNACEGPSRTNSDKYHLLCPIAAGISPWHKKTPFSTQSGKPGVLPQRQFGYRAPSSPCSAENAARLKPTHPGCVSVPMLTPGKFPSYEKDKNKKNLCCFVPGSMRLLCRTATRKLQQ